MNHFNIIVDYDEECKELLIINGYTDKRKKICNVKSVEDVSECITDYLKERN